MNNSITVKQIMAETMADNPKYAGCIAKNILLKNDETAVVQIDCCGETKEIPMHHDIAFVVFPRD